MSFLPSILIIAASFALAFYFYERLCDEKILDDRRWIWIWAGKGLAVPILVWIIFNSGSAPWLRRVFQAKLSGGPWFRVMLWDIVPGVLVIATFWLALTSGWWLFRVIRLRRRNWDDYKALIIFWSMFLVPLGALIMFGGGLWSVGFALALWFFPILYSALAIEQAKDVAPNYSTAIAKMKFGKYAEAENEVIEELEKCENDFEGWLMLAELYATQFHDLAEAEATIRDLCSQPTTNATQVSIAFHRLADWQLKLNQNPDAARRALETVCSRFPGTHLAKMAALRINQLPATKEEWIESRGAKTIHLPHLSNELDDDENQGKPALTEQEATHQANQCVAKLNQEPSDVAAREKLARLFAEHLNQPELGIEQMDLLLSMPEQPDHKKAEWLACIAAWHLKLKDDPAAKTFLKRLIMEFPNSPQAFSAQRKLNLLKR